LSRQRRFNSVHAADQSSDYARIVGEMGAPLAVTVWSFVILAIVIAVPIWLVLKVTNRNGRNSSDTTLAERRRTASRQRWDASRALRFSGSSMDPEG
jgi:type IV secretory pathway VirB3-like protein